MMIKSVIAGVISNVLTHVLLKTNRTPKNILNKKDSIRAIVDKATVNHVRDNIKNGDVDDRLNNFLMSQEVVTVLSKIFIFDLSENYINADEYNDDRYPEMDSRLGHFVRLERAEEQKAHPEKIFGEFKALFNLYYDSEYNEEEYNPRKIFDCLFSACIDSLNLAIERGYINGLEATSILRHRILYGKLEQIERNIHFLTSSNKVPLLSINELESKYVPLLKQRYSYIEPSGVDKVHRLPISSIYVEPDFNINNTEEKITLSDLSLHLTRQVILGDPGCGKTTLSRVLTYYFSTRERDELVIPFLITLREYGEVCNTQELSFIEYVVHQLKVSFQLAIADGVVEYLLVTGRAFVVFDGLDELMEVRHKKKMREKIESFSSLYPDTVVLVTSRKVGYSHAPLSDDQFETLTISPFSEEQIMEYAVKWFNENYEDSSESPQEKSSAFYDEVITTIDLCENPLMLSLMCTIYKNLNYIPKNRADVYEKCADLLFYRWDSSRGIKVELPFAPHLRRIISKLAYLLFTSEKTDGAVRESVLIKEVSDYLLDRCVDSREEAHDISIEMVSFFTGRSWVFTDTGTASNPAENVYQFTHRTFMEYFAACRISETYRTIDDVIELLYPKICTMEWDIVVQLVFNLMDRNDAEFSDELIAKILERLDVDSDVHVNWNVLTFMVKCLAFLTPRPRIIRLLVSKYVFVYLLNKNKSDNELALGLTDLKYFIRLVPESAKLVEYELGRVVGRAIESNNQHLKLFAAETFLDFVVHDVSDIDALTFRCVRIISGRDDAMSTHEVVTLLKENYQLEA